MMKDKEPQEWQEVFEKKRDQERKKETQVLLDDQNAMEEALQQAIDDEYVYAEKDKEKFKPIGVWIERPAADQSEQAQKLCEEKSKG